MEEEMRKLLLRDQLIESGKAEITPLTGGVSSEIYRVREGPKVFAVKRALKKLKVADDWYADLSRTGSEVEFLRCVGKLAPGAVPQVTFASVADGYFAMEFLDGGFRNWKTHLLEGTCEPHHARRAASVLARIHGGTWGDAEVRARFETTANFIQLRLDPYLLTTGRCHPNLEVHFVDEARRIETTRRCLIHGDYSPKNILLAEDRLVVLDCEVAWYGDPAFDIAFLLNHFFLKSLHHPDHRHAFFSLIEIFGEAYTTGLGAERASLALAPLPRLLPMLMLARVDGKSPVEYLRGEEKKQELIRAFAREHILHPPADLPELLEKWKNVLETL